MLGFKTKTRMPTLAENLALIRQIHLDFYNQENQLKQDLPTLIKEQKQLVDSSASAAVKYSKLQSLGFNQSKTTQSLQKVMKDNEEYEKVLRNMEVTLKALNVFKQTYPDCKFITPNQVIKLCIKYGFVCGPVTFYTGTIPDENMHELLNKVSKISNDFKFGNLNNGGRWGGNSNREPGSFQSVSYIGGNAAPLEIIAPKHEFDLKSVDFKDQYFLEEKIKPVVNDDPIVLQPVVYDGYKYYLIMTAWGDEANDPLVKQD